MKNNLSYYPREVGWHRHPKIKLLKAEYGLPGDSNFGTLCDCIAESDGCWLYLSKPFVKADIAERLKMSFEELDKFIDFLSGPCELIIKNDGAISTNTAQDTLREVNKDREKARLRYNKSRDKEENIKTSPEVIKTSQDVKEKKDTKESKVNETKVNEIKETLRDHAREVSEFFGIREFNQAKVFHSIVAFIEFLDKKEKLQHFLNQFNFYKKLKESSAQERHRLENFIGTFEKEYEDGKWNAENWEHNYKLFLNKKNIDADKPIYVAPKSNRDEETELSPEQKKQKHQSVMLELLEDNYDIYLEGGEVRDPTGGLAKFLTEKGKMNGSIQGVFEKIKKQGVTVREYING